MKHLLTGLMAMMLGSASVLAAGTPHIISTPIGPVWADSHGMTLYVLDRDRPLTSTCYGRCSRVWPPLWAPVEAGYAGAWTAIVRPDGSKMWAYRGHPLYRYVRDQAPGMVTGEGVVDRWGIWHAARPF